MKIIITIRKLFFFFAVVAMAGSACKKTEIVTITIQQPVAAFSVNVADPFTSYQTQSTVNYIDSNFYFRNGSDTGVNIKYTWDFGDGTTSTDKDPKHSYSKRGNYAVKLIVSNNNKAFDTVQQNVTVILGQQVISIGSDTDISPVAIEETSANEFVLLASGGYTTNYSYYLFQLDSLLKQKTMKTFPAGYHFKSMQATADGNYIFTGSTHGSEKNNELVKMKADGTQLWSKTLSTDDSYSFAAQTPDGGYTVVGTRTVTTGNEVSYNTVVIKTDDNGSQQWQKVLDGEGIAFTNNAIIEQNGIALAGVKRGNCYDCDSVMVVKLNNTGNVVWKNVVIAALNTNVEGATYITKLTNGNYAVTTGNTSGIFFFSPTGAFLDRKLAGNPVAAVCNSGDGNLIVLQTEYGNGFRINIAKLTLDGVEKWYAHPDGRQKVSGGFSCCSDSRPVAIQRLHNGGVIVTGSNLVHNLSNYSNHSVILLLQLDEDGKPK
jgi:PKD repeat protein